MTVLAFNTLGHIEHKEISIGTHMSLSAIWWLLSTLEQQEAPKRTPF
jgi:hypothetical protein